MSTFEEIEDNVPNNCLKISTITAVCNINSSISLNDLYERSFTDKNIIYIEYGSNKNLSNFKGINPNKKKKPKKRFDNQLTIVYKDLLNNVNVKLFKNGKIQMTGLKSEKQGKTIVLYLINYINKLNDDFSNILLNNTETTETTETSDIDSSLYLSNYKICLINCDFKINFKIKRKDLFEYLLNNTDLIVSFEPCIYPGVKIQFFYNEKQDGVCNCETFCCKKNKMICSKITIAVFESGCIIITGSKNIKHTNVCHKFIENIILKNKRRFEKIELIPRISF